jgi:hypothetical protein
MEQNENLFAPEPATDEPGSSFLLPAARAPSFATAAEEAAYRADLADGARGSGPAGLDFDPVATRYRHDGITPAKQREYVEALADCGIARVAAARIGVSEQAVNRLRRRADARSFNLACEAAQRFGARRLHSIAWERAIEGTIRRHYYHGELKSEERVYDNRLLVYLLGKTEHLLDEPEEARAVAENWEPFVEAIEQGLPPPGEVGEEDDPTELLDKDGLFKSIDVWEEPDGNWTSFPPPAGFDGEQRGRFGDHRYQRTLSENEEALIEASEAEDRAAKLAVETVRRDRFFGFDGGSAEEEIFSPREAELSETSAPASSPGFPGEGNQPRAGGGASSAQDAPPPRRARSPSPAKAGEDIGEKP